MEKEEGYSFACEKCNHYFWGNSSIEKLKEIDAQKASCLEKRECPKCGGTLKNYHNPYEGQ